MSTDASTGATDPDPFDEYDSMLRSLDAAIEEAQEKVESGRVYDPENEKVRIKWIRALAYTVNVRRQVQNDRDLAELAEEVEQLKEATDLEGDE
ncbi:hypothetical protein GCM10008995_29110 [Halobellus salinus]|uniref:DUF8136 domain-containing protein n=1 Tax=Halobellus salinus TaxID=931585 RepID=A0A830EWI2_9EURY|nr:hypothetical protein [Halobellus salinus]GGJ17526.1 hypothetical protein GCM10008995_29110 [Halobellus salinus]SMP35523.1 hypothetical protein SAMN06265347_13111 [Halobellus salinus]